ncbi:MAG: SusC/RagA family TonB-linked outer membrane protein [Bacteroidales bacterium]|nr:SusC/RagA family TonB-linked outer membrane protein [Bacteroidales bacterium]
MSVKHPRLRSLVSAMLLMVLLLAFSQPITAQSTSSKSKGVELKGRVTDPEGQPIAGAVIQNLTEKTFTSTDTDGIFTLNIKNPQNSTMEVSFLGMETVTEELAGRVQLNVQMSYSQESLESSVVTGYQEIQLRKVTGAIATINANAIEERYSPSLLQNLEGRVAGLSTYGGKLTIRGVSSMYAESSPLLVVDGLPIEGDIDDLNPYDIESVNVLKDAAAAAIYGARASNGIIVITTKSAREKGRIDMDFSSNITIYQKYNLDYGDNFYMSPAQQVKVERDYYDYYFNTPEEIADPFTSFENVMATSTNYISPIHYAYYKMAKGEYTQAQVDEICDNLSNNNFAKEYGDAIYRRQVIQQYNLAIRSRSDKFQSNVVVNYRTDNAGTINNFDNQMTISYKGAYDIAPWLTATMAVNGIYGKQRQKGQGSSFGPWSYAAYETLTNEDGTPRLLGTNHYRDNTEGGQFKELGINPVDEYYNDVQNASRQYVRYHGDLLFKILSGLTANAQIVYETDHRTTDWQANQNSRLAKLFYNAYKEIDPETGMITYHTPETGGYRNVTNMDGRYWTARGQLNYNGTFGKHEIVALAGTEFRETLYAGTRSLMLGYDDQLQNAATQLVDFGALSQMENSPSYLKTSTSAYPAYSMVYRPYIDGKMSPITEQHHRYASAYANFTYTYDKRYNVFGSYRKDYADVYGLNVKLRGRPLWSAGVAWNIGEEAFVKGFNWLSSLKLRLSYGITGNIYQGATSYMTANSDGLNTITGLPYGYIESPANPNLKWEQTRTINVGLDYSFVDNRFRSSLDYYRKRGLDLFSYKNLDPTTGFTQMFVNSADMVNHGVDLIFTGDWFRQQRRSDFGWSSTLTFAVNHNEITSVDNPAIQAYQRFSNPYVVGYPTSAIWSYQFAGISDKEDSRGMTLWYGKVNEETGERTVSTSAGGQSVDVLTYSGQADPVVIAGLDNRFEWNGFSLSILMAYYGGHKMRALAEDEIMADVIQRSPTALPQYFTNAWTPEKPTLTPGIGRYSTTGHGSEPTHSDISVRDASFLKIRNIVFGYELPEKWAHAIKVDRVNVQFQIDNLPPVWTAFRPGKEMSYYSKSAIFDPETGGAPQRSSYIFGVHINF